LKRSGGVVRQEEEMWGRTGGEEGEGQDRRGRGKTGGQKGE
jgi:hypothetical protein